jgi:hypothetical protein
MLVVVLQRAAKLGNALEERIIGHHDVRPDRRQQFIFGHEATGIAGEVPQELERLGPKGDLFVPGEEAATLIVEHVSVESNSRGTRGS